MVKKGCFDVNDFASRPSVRKSLNRSGDNSVQRTLPQPPQARGGPIWLQPQRASGNSPHCLVNLESEARWVGEQRRASPNARPSGGVWGTGTEPRRPKRPMGRSVQSHFIRLSLSAPEVPEAIRRQFGIANRVLDVLVPEVGLQGAGVVAFVRQGKAAGMPEHVRMSLEAQLKLQRWIMDRVDIAD
jgi:hypothetical protein